jgi:hypothetical protein
MDSAKANLKLRHRRWYPGLNRTRGILSSVELVFLFKNNLLLCDLTLANEYKSEVYIFDNFVEFKSEITFWRVFKSLLKIVLLVFKSKTILLKMCFFRESKIDFFNSLGRKNE